MLCKFLTPVLNFSSRRVAIGLIMLLVQTVQPAISSESVRILAFGDSLTAGYGLAPAESFPAQLQAALAQRGYAVDVINGGVSGDTTSGGRARLDWALSDQPSAVILELGANDGMRAVDPQLTKANLANILERLKSAGVPVLLTGMLAPPNLGPDYTSAFDAIFAQLASRYDVPLYPFFLAGVATIPELNQPDGIHPTAAGISVIVERILPYVIRLVEQAQA